jgi:sugar/nucleoside kinase (ribokinase family)
MMKKQEEEWRNLFRARGNAKHVNNETKLDLVVIGHLMKEMIIFPDQVVGPVLGSASAYFSVITGKLGAHSGLVSKIGRDFPRELLEPLHEAGVDTRGLIIEGEESRLSELIYVKDGNKTMRYPVKGLPINFEDIPEDYLQAEIIYIAPQEWEISYHVIEKIYSYNKRLAVELAGYGGAHCSYHSSPKDFIFVKKILPYFHIAKLSIEDCKYFFGATNEREIAKEIIAMGVEVCIVTLAGRGAIVVTADNIYEIPPLTKNAVDCTGAGDAFAAGFLFSYVREKDIRKAGMFASATASTMIEKKGGMKFDRMPTLSQVEKKISEFQSK